MRALPLAVLAASALALAACDSGRDLRPTVGQFEADVRGDLSRDLAGDAAFLVEPGGPGTGLFVTLIDRGSMGDRSVSINDPDGRLRAVGTYGLDIGGGSVTLAYADAPGDISRYLTATGGTVRITEAGPDRIVGTVSAEVAAGFRRDGPRSTLTAEFEAVRVESPR